MLDRRKPQQACSLRQIPFCLTLPFQREVLCRQHKNANSPSDKSAVLLVTQLDSAVSEQALTQYYNSTVGDVQHTTLKTSRKTTAASKDAQDTRLAYVSFADAGVVPEYVARTASDTVHATVPLLCGDAHSFKALLAKSAKEYTRPDKLRRDVDSALEALEIESRRNEQRALEAATNPDADGFVVVTRNRSAHQGAKFSVPGVVGSTGDNTGAPLKGTLPVARRRKRAGRGGTVVDFYEFQEKDQKRTELCKRRKTAASDKELVEVLRGQNFFKNITNN